MGKIDKNRISNNVLQHFTPDPLRISLKNQYDCLNKNGQAFHTLWKESDKKRAYKDILDVRYEVEDIETLKGEFRIKAVISFKEMADNDSIIVILEK